MHASPTPDDFEVDVPTSILDDLKYPQVALTRFNCPREHCCQPLAYYGTKSNNITDDAGYIVGHEETEVFECFAGHSVNEKGEKRFERNTA